MVDLDFKRNAFANTLSRGQTQRLGLARVLLHDPQTAGLAPILIEHGARVIWRCHIGHDGSTEHSEQGWEFLRPYLEDVPAIVFSKKSYAPDWCNDDRLTIIRPSIPRGPRPTRPRRACPASINHNVHRLGVTR